jgi:hypothetical protein
VAWRRLASGTWTSGSSSGFVSAQRSTVNRWRPRLRSILVDAAREPGTEYGLGDRIHAIYEGSGDDFEIPERCKDLPRAAEFDR